MPYKVRINDHIASIKVDPRKETAVAAIPENSAASAPVNVPAGTDTATPLASDVEEAEDVTG
jgi:hypothetical protein